MKGFFERFFIRLTYIFVIMLALSAFVVLGQSITGSKKGGALFGAFALLGCVFIFAYFGDKFSEWKVAKHKAAEAEKQEVEEMNYLTAASEHMKKMREAEARKAPKSPAANPLCFKDAQAAFEYSCRFMDCGLRNGSILPALVLDSRQLFGTEIAVIVRANGLQGCFLRIASDDDGFVVFAETVGAKGPKLEPGMLVAWQAGEYSVDVAKAGSWDQRFGWVGLIIATLHPHFDIEEGWIIHTPFNT